MNRERIETVESLRWLTSTCSEEAKTFKVFFAGAAPEKKLANNSQPPPTVEQRLAAAVAAHRQEGDQRFEHAILIQHPEVSGWIERDINSPGGRMGPGHDDIQQAVQEAQRQCDAAFVQHQQTYVMPQANTFRTQSSRLGNIDIWLAIELG